MKLAAFLSPGGDLALGVDLASRADALGYDTAWVAEHHFSNQYGIMPDVFTYMGYLAARTERIRLSTAVVTLPLYEPVRVVENMAFVDILSGGRVTLGLGSGYRPYEFEGFGRDFDARRDVQEEAIDVILRLVHERRVQHAGARFRALKRGRRAHEALEGWRAGDVRRLVDGRRRPEELVAVPGLHPVRAPVGVGAHVLERAIAAHVHVPAVHGQAGVGVLVDVVVGTVVVRAHELVLVRPADEVAGPDAQLSSREDVPRLDGA